MRSIAVSIIGGRPAASRAGRSLIGAIVVAMLGAALALHGSWDKSETADERGHVTAGHAYWRNNDYRLQPENGNLPQRIIGLPNLVAGAAPPAVEGAAWKLSSLFIVGYNYFYSGPNDAATLLRRSRAAIAVATALIGIALFMLSTSISGTLGGWITLVLFAFSPAVLAHGALATSDMIAAGAFVMATWALWTMMERLSIPRLLLASTAVAALALSKFSAPIIVPVAVCLIGMRVFERRPLRLRGRGRQLVVRSRRRKALALTGAATVVAVLAVTVIWAAYGFRYEAFNPSLPGPAQFNPPWNGLKLGPLTWSITGWLRTHELLPEAYLYGFGHVLSHAEGRFQFLRGVVANHGWPHFFPYAALVKSTIPELLAAFSASAILAMLCARGTPRQRYRVRRLLPFLLLAAWYSAFAIASPLNIGFRHLLPVVLCGLILAGFLALPLSLGWRWRSAVQGRRRYVYATAIAAMLVWHVTDAVRVAPHFLAYFNSFAGGPKEGYRHLLDSSLDWGQDLPGLKRWLDANNPPGPVQAPVYLAYFGNAPPEYYGIRPVYLPGFPDHLEPRVPPPLRAGVYCLSANLLQALYVPEAPGVWSDEYERRYQDVLHNLGLLAATASDPAARARLIAQTGPEFWPRLHGLYERLRFARLAAYLRRRTPDHTVGYSIFVYRLSDADVATALSGPMP